MIAALVFATFLPLVVYMIVGLRREAKADTLEDYFLYGQRVSSGDYANTSIGYALQMSAVSLFAAWGVLFGVGSFYVPLFWMLGYLLLATLLPRFSDYHEKRTTLHQFLAERFKNSTAIKLLASVATIIGLWGTAMTELDFTTQLYTPLIRDPLHLFGLLSAFLLFGAYYIIRNGYKAEIQTERLQVPLAFGTFNLFLILLLPATWSVSSEDSYRQICILLILCFVGMIAGKWFTAGTNVFRDPQVWIPLMATFAVIALWLGPQSNASGIVSVIDKPLKQQISAQGSIGLISLFLANVLWNIADLSSWQRIASVQREGGQYPLKALRRGTFRVAFESPASWCLGVAFGWLLVATGILPKDGDPYASIGLLGAALASGKLAPYSPTFVSMFMYPLIAFAFISIMLSTVNALISAIGYTTYCDLLGKSIDDRKTDGVLRSARMCTWIILLAGLALFWVVRNALGTALPTFLYVTYSAQLSLFPIAFLALYNRNLNRLAAIISLVTGICFAFLAWFLANRMPPDDLSAPVLPPLFAVVGATVAYTITYAITKKPK